MREQAKRGDFGVSSKSQEHLQKNNDPLKLGFKRTSAGFRRYPGNETRRAAPQPH